MKRILTTFLAFLIIFQSGLLVLAEEPSTQDPELPENISDGIISTEVNLEEEITNDETIILEDTEIPVEAEELIEEELEENEWPLILINEVLADSVGPDAEFEFIELYNPGPNPVDMTGWKLDDSQLDDGKAYTINATLEPGAFLVFYRPETKITLNNDVETIYLFDAMGLEVDRLEFESAGSGISWGRTPDEPFEWVTFEQITPGEKNLSTQENLPEPVDETPEIPLPEDVAESESQTEPEEAGVEEPEESTAFSQILINEIQPNPDGEDELFEFIELYNPNDQPVDMTGWSLDDSALEDSIIYKFNQPEKNYILGSKEYAAFFRPETGITLNNTEDAVRLFDINGTEVDSYHYISAPSGRSWGRRSEALETWMLFPEASPGQANIFLNQAPTAVISLQGGTGNMTVNVTGESSADPDGDSVSYFWEFESGSTDTRSNPTAYVYQSSGTKAIRLTVTDEFGASNQAQIIFEAEQAAPQSVKTTEALTSQTYPHYSLINEFLPNPPGTDSEGEWVELYNSSPSDIDLSGWYLDDAEGASSPFQIPTGTVLKKSQYLVFHAPNLNISLANTTDVVRLLDPNKQESEQINYQQVKENWSYAKDSNGDFSWTPILTPGEQNNLPTPPRIYQKGDVVFESVLPDPNGPDAGLEQIVIKNHLNEAVNLDGWKIGDLSGEKTLGDLGISANASLTLTSSDFKLNLNNSDESLFLYDPLENLIDEISWKDSVSGAWLFNPDSLLDGMVLKVTKVIDGDTFVADFEEKLLTIRMMGVDTPETVHPFKPVEYFGKQASDYLKTMLTGKKIELHFDTVRIDKYGRVLGYVYLDGQLVNAELIEQGYGYAYTRFPFRMLNEFVALESQAKSAGRGMWQDPEVKKMIEETMIEEEQVSEEGLLILEMKDRSTEVDEETDEEEVEASEPTSDETMDCHSEFLKIETISPNPQKGVSEEYIRLINTGPNEVCLTGWKLDDVLEKGSKPFSIKEGSIAPGTSRTFLKTETKLSLNNSNDCASLIDPSGKLADELCYQSTHLNEIFSHSGGNWVAKKSSSKVTKAKLATPRHSFKRSGISYHAEMVNEVVVGRIESIDHENMMIKILTEKGEETIFYGESSFDADMLTSLMGMEGEFKFNLFRTSEQTNLVGLEPIQKNQLPMSTPIKISILIFIVSLSTLTIFIKYIKIMR